MSGVRAKLTVADIENCSLSDNCLTAVKCQLPPFRGFDDDVAFGPLLSFDERESGQSNFTETDIHFAASHIDLNCALGIKLQIVFEVFIWSAT